MQVEVKEENIKKENGWIKSLKKKFEILERYFGDRSVVFKILVSKRFNLPVNSLFMAKLLKLRYDYLGIDVPISTFGFKAYELMSNLEDNSRFVRSTLSEFLYLTRGIKPRKPVVILSHLVANYTVRPIENIINDYYSKVYVVSYVLTLARILNIDQREVLRIFGIDVSDERWRVWQSIIYIILSSNSQREEIIEKRNKHELFLQEIFTTKMELYSNEFFFVDQFFNGEKDEKRETPRDDN